MKKPLSAPDQKRAEKLNAFDRLLTIMDELRENCPWDKKQTLQSLRHLTIEETYELSDAILNENIEEIKKELGDLMLHMVFYTRIASEQRAFDIADVMHSICEKLIHRHPHIYGDAIAEDVKTVKENWEKIKLKEGKNKTVLGGVPKSLPALVKAIRIQEKARGVGFDWDNKSQVWAKVLEELDEFHSEQNPELKAAEFGDVLFALINYARFEEINPEQALEKTNIKFTRRFNYMEDQLNNEGKKFADLNLQELEAYWNKAKSMGL